MTIENREWFKFPDLESLPTSRGFFFCMEEKGLPRLQITTTEGEIVIVEYHLFSSDSRISLNYSADGYLFSVRTSEDASLRNNCSFEYDVISSELLVNKNPDYEYSIDGREARITDQNNGLRLSISKAAFSQDLYFSSDSWVNPNIKVNLSPVNMERLYPISLGVWKNPEQQERLIGALDSIMREKIQTI